VWKLNKLNEKYRNLIERCEELEEKIEVKGRVDIEERLEFFDLYLKFKQCLNEDSYLPEKFLKKWL
jgi:DNA-binding transcriptional regulator PaaX